ncbi:MAG: DUF2065 domain-containing protein [Mariprofundaceae bacterium]|nr:DUF2065 domain-containing protein [Mariprofundaceae bacterium]
MQDLWIALGLVMLLEGAVYALFPNQMIEMMRRLPDIPPASLRVMGIIGVMLGWLVIHLVRG